VFSIRSQNNRTFTTETQFGWRRKLMLFAGAASIVMEVVAIQPLASVTV
jgi:hypothetical protein